MQWSLAGWITVTLSMAVVRCTMVDQSLRGPKWSDLRWRDLRSTPRSLHGKKWVSRSQMSTCIAGSALRMVLWLLKWPKDKSGSAPPENDLFGSVIPWFGVAPRRSQASGQIHLMQGQLQ